MSIKNWQNFFKFSSHQKKKNKEKLDEEKLLQAKQANCVSAKAQLAPILSFEGKLYVCVGLKKHPEFFPYPETVKKIFFFACNPAVREKENERNKEYNACQIHPENIDP